MKKLSKGMLLLLFVFSFGLLLNPGMTLRSSAAGKNGLIQKKDENKNYVYYKNGKKLKNQWKRVSVDGEKYWFYFKANGNAYKGSTKKVWLQDEETGDLVKVKVQKPLVKTIDGTVYAFDSNGHALTGVQYFDGEFYYFSANRGKYSAAKSQKLRDACQYGEKTNLPSLLKKYGVKRLKKTDLGTSCMGSGHDWIYEYDGFSVTLLKKKDGTYVFQSVEQTK